jgi:alkaline phosphatase D
VTIEQGDPFHDTVLLWTRAVPTAVVESSTPVPDQSVPVCVSYKVFSSPALSGHPISLGEAFTSYDVDFTVKVEATGLKPDSKYWYFFADCADPKNTSPVGMTRTISRPNSTCSAGVLPVVVLAYSLYLAPASEVNGGKNLSIAVFSCSRYQQGMTLIVSP